MNLIRQLESRKSVVVMFFFHVQVFQEDLIGSSDLEFALHMLQDAEDA